MTTRRCDRRTGHARAPEDRAGSASRAPHSIRLGCSRDSARRTTDTYTLCLYDGGDALLVEAIVPPGGTCGAGACWKDLSGLGAKYVDKGGTVGNVRKVVLKSGDEGRAKAIVKVQGGGLGLPALPPALPLRAQLASTTGTCWEAEFRADGVTRSTPTEFGAKPHVD